MQNNKQLRSWLVSHAHMGHHANANHNMNGNGNCMNDNAVSKAPPTVNIYKKHNYAQLSLGGGILKPSSLSSNVNEKQQQQ